MLPAQEASAEPATTVASGLEKDRDRMIQLQIFLDKANFGPGKLDGRWGEFTRKALARYLEAQGAPVPELGDQMPAEFPVDVSGVQPVYTTYQITQEDLDSLGDIPDKDYPAQEKLDAMTYETALELVAERFHADEDFIKALNPGVDVASAQAGTTVKVPAVAKPFNARDVKYPEQGKEHELAQANSDPEAEKSIIVNTGENMLDYLEDGKLKASFPITPGSEATPAPKGEWKIKLVAYMPDFRRDESLLKEGVRSDEAHMIPPGPNNPVGVVWLGLDKDGIGIHGTHDPDSIGRSASHGCVRLANWDIIELAPLVKAGVPVTIR